MLTSPFWMTCAAGGIDSIPFAADNQYFSMLGVRFEIDSQDEVKK